MDKYAKETGGALRQQRPRRAQGRLGRSDRPHLSRHDAARDPAERPGHRRADGARHPRELRRRRPRCRQRPRWRICSIEAMKLAFADIWRYVADPRFMEVTPAQMLDKGYLKSRAKLIDPKKAQDFGPGVPEGRRHDLSRHRRRRRHDGVADPVELHRLRLGHRACPGTGIALQNRALGLRHHQGPSQPGRPEEAAVPHHHPGLHHQGRQAGRDLRRDGRRHAAAGPHAGLLAHRRLRPEPAGRHRRAALARARDRRTIWTGSTCRPTPRRASRRAATSSRAPWPSVAFGSSQIIWKFPEGGPYLGASESRRDGAAVGF